MPTTRSSPSTTLNGNATRSMLACAGPSGSASYRRCLVRRAQRGHGNNEDAPSPNPRSLTGALASRRVRSSRRFDIHAGVSVSAHDREGRERPLRYCARPALSLERLSVLADGRVAYRIENSRGPQTSPRDEPDSVSCATLRPHSTPASSARARPRRLRSAFVMATLRRGLRARGLACRAPRVASVGRRW